jgi:hypothetical protein
LDQSVIVNQGSGAARPAKLSLARCFRIAPASRAIPGRILVPLALVQIRGQARLDRLRFSIEGDSDYAARAACRISGILALRPPSLPTLNCPFLIFTASSMPPITIAAGSNALQTQHWAESLLDPTMILFDGVVQILAGSYQHVLRQSVINRLRVNAGVKGNSAARETTRTSKVGNEKMARIRRSLTQRRIHP